MPMGQDRVIKAIANSMPITPVIIGLRTYRYGPATTSRCGGSQGAGVPEPKRKNMAIDDNENPAAGTASTHPNQNPSEFGSGRVAANRVPDVSQKINPGTKRSTVPGNTMMGMIQRDIRLWK